MEALKTHLIYGAIIVILGGALGGTGYSLCGKTKALKQAENDVSAAQDKNDKLVEECDHQLQEGVTACRNILSAMDGDCDIIIKANKRIAELYNNEDNPTPDVKKLGLSDFVHELELLIKEGRDEMDRNSGTDPGVTDNPL